MIAAWCTGCGESHESLPARWVDYFIESHNCGREGIIKVSPLNNGPTGAVDVRSARHRRAEQSRVRIQARFGVTPNHGGGAS